jgi:hypothetical protein
MQLKAIAKGLLSYVPGTERFLSRAGTGGTNSAIYCYGVWLKHLTMLWANGMRSLPQTLAELGPGDSIGTGLAAMLSGIDRYFALDVVRFANAPANLHIFDELVALFRRRAGRPQKGWPDFDGYLDARLFPSHILTEKVLASALSEERIARIRAALIHPETEQSGIRIQYMAPWYDDRIIARESVDVIMSHSVLEHVVDVERTHAALSQWLKPGGWMTHQIDFSAHGLSEQWNGFRAYPEVYWKLIMGRRTYLINRQPCSVHVACMEKNRFEIRCLMKNTLPDGLARSQLAARWKDISDDDLNCSGAFIQAQKRLAPPPA